ncbi:MAG: sigma-70 family RNA polymerase sigma factor [Acidobacteria bacterium]|nr:sigma-70 family RNA polymerase sigma factor [Acidobacteriota bacterium]
MKRLLSAPQQIIKLKKSLAGSGLVFRRTATYRWKAAMIPQQELKRIGEEFHHRLVLGNDRFVSVELCEFFLPLLTQALSRRFYHLKDPHLAETFAIDTMLKYLAAPKKFQPEKSSLIGYLYIDAFGDLLNYLDKHKKFVEHHIDISEVDRRGITASSNPEATVVEKSASLVDEVLAKITDPIDVELIELLLQREHRTARFAEVLGIQELSREKKFAEVKKHKDRLKTKLKRQIEKTFGKHLEALLRYAKSQKSNR